MLTGNLRIRNLLDLRIAAVVALSILIVLPASSALGQVIPGIDFNTDATFDTDADSRWEDTTLGNPSTFDFFLDTVGVDAVTRNTGVSAGFSGIDAAYDFVGGATGGGTGGNPAGALLSTTGTGTRRSFQNAPDDWTNENVTIEIWFKPGNLTPTPTNGQILFEDGGGTGLGFFVDNNQLQLRKAPPSPASTLVTSNISGISGEFIQAVGTFNRGPNPDVIELFINGASVGTDAPGNNGGDWSGGDAAGVGTRGGSNAGGIGSGDSNTESYDGEIAIFRVYRNQILTSQQVLNNYNSVLNGVFLDTSGDWSTNTNWLGDLEPTASDNAYVNNGLTATITATGEVASNVAVGSPDGAGGSGQLNITGGDLTITNNFQLGGNLDTGSNLRGNVTQNDGAVAVGGDLVFGGAAGTEGGTYNLNSGTLTVTGDIVESASNVDSAQLHLNGGTLAVPNGATTSSILVQRFSVAETTGTNVSYTANAPITTTGTLAVGGFSNAIGNMTIDDSSFPVNANDAVLGQGNTADGTLTVEGSGVFNVTNSDFHIAGDATGGADSGTSGDFILNAGGTVTVSGGNTEVGTGGTGTFTMNGGTFTQLTNNFVVAQDGASSGTVDMNGGTLDITNGGGSNQDLNMNSGLAVFNHNGGDVTVERDLQMATQNVGTSDSTYNLDAGAGSLDIGRHLIVGGDRVGEFNYESGTFSIGGTIYVGGDTAAGAGANPNADGTINIGSLGGTPTMNTGQFEVGRHNIGVVNQDDGIVNVNSGNLVVSQLANSNGTYNLNAGDLNVTNLLNVNTGTGTFNVNGGTATIGGNINLSNNNATGNATVNVDGGDLIVNGAINYRNNGTDTINVSAGSLDLTGGNIIGATGTNDFNLSGTGTLKDVNIMGVDLDQSGGLLRIGPDATVDTMTLNGDYNQTAGVLEIDIASLALFDTLDVNGDASLNGTIKLLNSTGFALNAGSTFDILFADSITGSFTLDQSMFDFNGTAGVFKSRILPGEVLQLVALVPEPSTLAIFSLGLLVLPFVRRRRRANR